MEEAKIMIEILRDFNARNEETNLILDDDNQPMEIEKKTALLSKIFVLLQHTKDFKMKFECLRAIHYFIRDGAGVLPLLSSQSIKTIKENFLIDLNEENEEKEEKEKLKFEALKCLVSISSLSEDLNHLHLNDLNLVQHLLSSLPDESIKDEKKNFYCRLLFRLCLISSLKQFILTQSIFLTLLNNIRIKEEREVGIEILDLLYILSTQLGPIEGPTPPSPEQLLVFLQFKEYFNTIMEIPIEEIEFLHLKENTIKCFVNLPKENNNNNNNDNDENNENISSFLSFLLYHLQHPSNPKSKVVPVLILLSSFARSSKNGSTKEFILNNVFPGWQNFEADPPDAPKELQNKETAEGRLVSYMTSQSPVLSFCVSDFIFALCGDNGQTFVELVGMGNAFSLLSDRNLIDTVKSPHPQRRKEN